MDTRSLIIGFILGIIGSFFAALFSHFFSERRRKREEFNRAAVEFQCAFLEARQRLRDDERSDWFSILNPNVLLEHEKAALKFTLYLDGADRCRFDVDWQAYFNHVGGRPPEKAPTEWKNEDNCKKFIEQIEALFSHAKLCW